MSLNFSETVPTCTKSEQFKWSSLEQGYLLGGWFYGYITSQVLGGMLADRYNPVKQFGWGIFITAFLSLLTPLSTSLLMG
jgi:ACS family sodium-dependent inorganic phosphate cotransporter